MGRQKNYDRSDLIQRATALFREHGYAETSTAMLTEALGVNKKSLYAEFGLKKALFEACLEHYNDTNVERNFSPLEQPEAGLDEVIALFTFFGRAASGPAAGLGCLLCNTAVEFGRDDPSGHRFVERYFKRISSALTHALRNAERDGRLYDGVDVKAEAQTLTASVLGLFVMLRAGAKPSLIKGAAQATVRQIEQLVA